MAEEMVDIFDENYVQIGTDLKSNARHNGSWVRSIHCWFIRPSSGYVLFQRRGAGKKIFPSMLDITAAGHYKAGENIAEGVREISEELGVEVQFKSLVNLGIKHDVAKVNDSIVHEFCHVFFYISDKRPAEYELGLDEVEGLVEIDIDSGLKLFSGEAESALAKGIQYNKADAEWENIEIRVDKNSFIPRIDSYYYKVFINAKNYLNGSKYLSI